jgi:hypothetical protein
MLNLLRASLGREARGRLSILRIRAQSLVDLGDFSHPALTLPMFESEDLIARPMEVKGYIRYLLIKPL